MLRRGPGAQRPMHPRAVFFFKDPATTEICTLSLHDALPISPVADQGEAQGVLGLHPGHAGRRVEDGVQARDRKSTRLNSSHMSISYAVFCLKKEINTLSRMPSPFLRANEPMSNNWRSVRAIS